MLTIVISYPTNASGIIVLLKTLTKYREFFPTLFLKTTDFQLVFNLKQTRTVTIFGEHRISLRKQQRNGLNGTVKRLNFFPFLRRKVELCCFLLTRQGYSKKGLLCRSLHKVLTRMAARLLDLRRRLPVAFFFLFT